MLSAPLHASGFLLTWLSLVTSPAAARAHNVNTAFRWPFSHIRLLEVRKPAGGSAGQEVFESGHLEPSMIAQAPVSQAYSLREHTRLPSSLRFQRLLSTIVPHYVAGKVDYEPVCTDHDYLTDVSHLGRMGHFDPLQSEDNVQSLFNFFTKLAPTESAALRPRVTDRWRRPLVLLSEPRVSSASPQTEKSAQQWSSSIGKQWSEVPSLARSHGAIDAGKQAENWEFIRRRKRSTARQVDAARASRHEWGVIGMWRDMSENDPCDGTQRHTPRIVTSQQANAAWDIACKHRMECLRRQSVPNDCGKSKIVGVHEPAHHDGRFWNNALQTCKKLKMAIRSLTKQLSVESIATGRRLSVDAASVPEDPCSRVVSIIGDDGLDWRCECQQIFKIVRDSQLRPTSPSSSQNKQSRDGESDTDLQHVTKFADQLRAKRSTTPVPRKHIMMALNKVIHRIGFEKYGKALKQILSDLQPIKEAVNTARHSMSHVENFYGKFENDLKDLLTQTKSTQQALLFMMSSLLQENIVLRRKLEECQSSVKMFEVQLRGSSTSIRLENLTEQLESKMVLYDDLLLRLMQMKASVEAERRLLLKERTSMGLKLPPCAQDDFSLSTLLSLMLDLGTPSCDQNNVNLLLARLFPGLYQNTPAASAPAHLSQPMGDWFRLLAPLIGAPQSRPLDGGWLSADYSSQPGDYVPRPAGTTLTVNYGNKPRAERLFDARRPVPPAKARLPDGEAFVTYMLDVLLRLHRAGKGQQDDSSIRQELADIGRYVLC